MIRNTIAAVAAIAALGMVVAPAADAKMCDKHGTGAGHIYIAACAKGPGGTSPDYAWTSDKDGDGPRRVPGWTRIHY